MDRFNPQNIANTLWAFAKLNLTPSAQLLDAASLVATKSIDSFNPQGITNTLWAFAKFDFRLSAELLDAASLVATNSMDSFNPQDIANMLWAFAKFDLKPSAKLLDAVSLVATNSMDSFNPQNIANMLWAFAKLDLTPSSQLLDAASLVATNSIDIFKPRDIANMLWAFAKFDLKPSAKLLDAACSVATKSMDSFNPQDIANMLWAFAVTDNSFKNLTMNERKALLELFKAADDRKVFDTRGKHQIYLAFQYFKYVRNLGEKLQSISQEWLADFRSKEQTISNAEKRELNRISKDRNITIFRQQFIPGVGTYVDGYFECAGKRYIIQIDGPQHFTKVNGKLIQKPCNRLIDAILKRLGFIVERIGVGI
jgi:very-short-patch-repair endonuclease